MSQMTTMTFGEARACARAVLPLKVPLMVWGPPGAGKSALARRVAADLGIERIYDLRGSLLDAVDLRGFPVVRDDGVTHWCAPAFLPRPDDGPALLLLDELTQSPPPVQAGMLQLFLDRRVGEYALPDDTLILAAGNRAEDRAGVQRLIAPLLNRMLHVELAVDPEEWLVWAAGAGVIEEVRATIAYRPELLFHHDPKEDTRAFPTPRAWEFASRVYPVTPEGLRWPLLEGTVGRGATAEFMAVVEVRARLVPVETLLGGAATVRLPDNPIMLHAQVGQLVEHARRHGDAPTLQALLTLANRMPRELSALLVAQAAKVQPALLVLPEAQPWLARHLHLLTD